MSDNDLEQQQEGQLPPANGLSKLDIALLAGVARQETKAGQNMNLKWLAKRKLVHPTDMRTCDDVASWSCMTPSDLDINGTELIRSPRSALAVLRNGAGVRDLVDSDLPALHALSRKAKLTKEETSRRIELDRARRDIRRNECKQAYGALCADFTREDLISAVRRFLFKGQAPEMKRQQMREEKRQQQMLLLMEQEARMAEEEEHLRIQQHQRQSEYEDEEEEQEGEGDDCQGEYIDEEAGEEYLGENEAQYQHQQQQQQQQHQRRQNQTQRERGESLPPSPAASRSRSSSPLSAQSERKKRQQQQQQQQQRPPSTSSSTTNRRQEQAQQRWSRPPSSSSSPPPPPPAPLPPRPASAAAASSTGSNHFMMYSSATASSSGSGTSGGDSKAPAFFSQLTCAPTVTAMNLLKEEDVANIVMRREQEAARVRKRLHIDAGHRAARILQEYKVVKEDDTAGNVAVAAKKRARERLEEKKRQAAERNEQWELRAARRSQELQEEQERKLDRFDEKNAMLDQRVDDFLAQRKKHFDRRRFVSAQSVVHSRMHGAEGGSSPAAAITENHHHHHSNPHHHSPDVSGGGGSITPQPHQSHHSSQRRPTGGRGGSVSSSMSGVSATPTSSTTAAGVALGANAFSRTNPFEIDDLLTEWRVQGCKQERQRQVHEQGRRRDEHLAHAAKNRTKAQRDAERRRQNAARKDEERSENAAATKQQLDSRVKGSFGLLARRIQNAQRFVEETDRQRAQRLEAEQQERLQRSEALLSSQARERRDKKVERLLMDDATDSWREQRKERGVLLNDAKRVLFEAHLEDIEEDMHRRHAVQEQLGREIQSIDKARHVARDQMLEEEKRTLEELGLKHCVH